MNYKESTNTKVLGNISRQSGSGSSGNAQNLHNPNAPNPLDPKHLEAEYKEICTRIGMHERSAELTRQTPRDEVTVPTKLAPIRNHLLECVRTLVRVNQIIRSDLHERKMLMLELDQNPPTISEREAEFKINAIKIKNMLKRMYAVEAVDIATMAYKEERYIITEMVAYRIKLKIRELEKKYLQLEMKYVDERIAALQFEAAKKAATQEDSPAAKPEDEDLGEDWCVLNHEDFAEHQ
ncbi:uncharacterized protein LOC132260526 [Phlebotomus argentipes]|uniref:uncharacterized protein LOC132260526 n=1 Tax=Phlebotomus argentipes TaxID=94469 RepID=UPI002893561B|nr:uncharacterized protein LOC132260526 [Phlebotomus argentipes]